jgi:hypothetical protein
MWCIRTQCVVFTRTKNFGGETASSLARLRNSMHRRASSVKLGSQRFEFVETLPPEQRAAGSFTPELIGIIKNATLDDLDELRKQAEQHDMRRKCS